MESYPSVSIVIVNRNGVSHLKDNLGSLRTLNYPKKKLEVIVVDNGSTDGSVELLRRRFPWVSVICNSRNEGFAGPSDQGARAAKGEYVAFLNNDMRVKKNWLIALVNTIRSEKADCAGSVICNWDGRRLDFAGGSVNFFGMGYQFDYGKPMKQVGSALKEDRDIFFACGGAMLISRQVFLEIGGFDKDYFAYFEDVDLGWRLHVLGYRVVLSARSRVFHRHQSTGARFGSQKLWFLYARNSLYTVYKNYSAEYLSKVLPSALMLDFCAFTDENNIDPGKYEIWTSGTNPVPNTERISSLAAAQLSGLRDFVVNLPDTEKKRDFIQSHRKTPDSEIIKFIPKPFIMMGCNPQTFLALQYNVAKAMKLDKLFHADLRKKILLVSSNPVGSKMTGPAIRYYELARQLSRRFDVILASPGGPTDLKPDGFKIIPYSVGRPDRLIEAACDSYIIVIQGYANELIDLLRQITKYRYLVYDLYDLFLVENLEQNKIYDMSLQIENCRWARKTLSNQLRTGDFLLCSDDAQKEYLLGMLSAYGRITPQAYQTTESGRNLIANVPFGLPDEPPVHTRRVLKGVYPGIGPDDKVLLWGGGVWNWFDPLTLIRAVALIAKKRGDVKLFFMGVRNPDPAFSETQMLSNAIELAKKLGVYDRFVFFNFDWVDYADRQNYLLEADVGVSCHFETLETHLSFRTRILDYLWAGLPVICTEGDHFARLVEKEDLGFTVKYGDPQDLADKILRLLGDPEHIAACRQNVLRAAQRYRWSETVKPLMEFCEHPRHLSPLRTKSENARPDGIFPSGGASPEDDSIPSGGDDREDGFTEPDQRSGNGDQTAARLFEQQHRYAYEINNRLKEIQQWTYMMNKRFNLFKRVLGPISWLRRLRR